MKNKILLFILISSPLLSQTLIYAQGIYTTTGIYVETCINTLCKINYTNSGPINSISERSQSAEPMFEVGGIFQTTKRLFIRMSFSNNNYHFTDNIYINSKSNNTIHINNHFKINIIGINMGLDITVFQTDKWSIYSCGKISGNLLNQGNIKGVVVSHDSSILSNINRDLMSNEEFKKLWFNIQFGIAYSYKISSQTSLYSKYLFNQSLTKPSMNNESFNFNNYILSLGLIYNFQKNG